MTSAKNNKTEEQSRLSRFLSEWGAMLIIGGVLVAAIVLAFAGVGTGDWANEPLARLAG